MLNDVFSSVLQPIAERMDYWGKVKNVNRKKRRCTSMALIDQFLFVLMRLKVGLPNFTCRQFEQHCILSIAIIPKIFKRHT